MRAWSYIDAAGALRRARALDRAGRSVGPLHGIPVGVKDIIDTADMPTEYGSGIYRMHRPAHDAVCVARLRAAGAVIIGKTKTSEFAYLSPADTRNPHNIRHTPGGSSSGSAAGVAAGMMPLALGTQTGGSTIRPAAYCGVYAFKPTYGCLSLAGVKSLANSYDTLGLITRSVDDLALLFGALNPNCLPRPRPPARLRVGYCQTPFWRLAEPATRRVLRDTAQTLATAGAIVEHVVLPSEVEGLNAGFYVVTAMEATWALHNEFARRRSALSVQVRKLVTTGFGLDAAEVQRVRRLQSACALAIDRMFDRFDVLLTPAAPGEPERGNALGNNEFNRCWTALHLPCITVPAGEGAQGLPIGIQLVGRRGADAALLAMAARVAHLVAI